MEEADAVDTGAADAASSGDLWWIGVIMSIAASVASNLGVNVQKFSLMEEAKRAIRLQVLQRPYMRQKLWWMGLSLVVLGSLGDFAALGFSAQSLITPVGGTTLVANVFFAHFWLKERLSRTDLMGTFGIICGVALIAIFADKSESNYTLDELVELYGEPLFIVYATTVVLFSGTLYLLARHIEVVRAVGGPAGAVSKRYLWWRPVHQFIYPTLSGVLGAQSVLFAKSTAELIKSSVRGENQWTDAASYAIAFCMFAAIFSQLHFLAVALKYFDAVYVIPVFQCFFITVTIVGGAMYFNEFASFSATQSIMFPAGVLVTLASIVVLSARRSGPVKGPRWRFRVAVHAVRFMVRTRNSADDTRGFRIASESAFESPHSAKAPLIGGSGEPDAETKGVVAGAAGAGTSTSPAPSPSGSSAGGSVQRPSAVAREESIKQYGDRIRKLAASGSAHDILAAEAESFRMRRESDGASGGGGGDGGGSSRRPGSGGRRAGDLGDSGGVSSGEDASVRLLDVNGSSPAAGSGPGGSGSDGGLARGSGGMGGDGSPTTPWRKLRADEAAPQLSPAVSTVGSLPGGRDDLALSGFGGAGAGGDGRRSSGTRGKNGAVIQQSNSFHVPPRRTLVDDLLGSARDFVLGTSGGGGGDGGGEAAAATATARDGARTPGQRSASSASNNRSDFGRARSGSERIALSRALSDHIPADIRRDRAHTDGSEPSVWQQMQPEWSVATERMLVPPPAGAVVGDFVEGIREMLVSSVTHLRRASMSSFADITGRGAGTIVHAISPRTTPASGGHSRSRGNTAGSGASGIAYAGVTPSDHDVEGGGATGDAGAGSDAEGRMSARSPSTARSARSDGGTLHPVGEADESGAADGAAGERDDAGAAAKGAAAPDVGSGDTPSIHIEMGANGSGSGSPPTSMANDGSGAGGGGSSPSSGDAVTPAADGDGEGKGGDAAVTLPGATPSPAATTVHDFVSDPGAQGAARAGKGGDARDSK